MEMQTAIVRQMETEQKQKLKKNGNVLWLEEQERVTRDDQSQLLPQSVTVTAADFTQALDEAMTRLNIHDESLLAHEIVEKGKRNFLEF